MFTSVIPQRYENLRYIKVKRWRMTKNSIFSTDWYSISSVLCSRLLCRVARLAPLLDVLVRGLRSAVRHAVRAFQPSDAGSVVSVYRAHTRRGFQISAGFPEWFFQMPWYSET